MPKSVPVEGSRNIKSGSAYPLKVYKQVTKIASHGDGGHMDNDVGKEKWAMHAKHSLVIKITPPPWREPAYIY